MQKADDPSTSDYWQRLQYLMHAAEIKSLRSLYNQGFSRAQVNKLRQGQIEQLQLMTLLKLCQTLRISLPELLQNFSPIPIFYYQPSESQAPRDKINTSQPEITVLQQEYQRLQAQYQEQRQQLWQEFQLTTLQALESFLKIWPTAAHAARKNPQAPAVQLLPLIKPIELMLQSWQVETIGEVGQEVRFDPRSHQLTQGTANEGATVQVTHVGYRQGDRLLFRAYVKPI
jgi:molecular chaperone GrpE (heat shock protein)/DNA-binding Xre family transcriptional regulator